MHADGRRACPACGVRRFVRVPAVGGLFTDTSLGDRARETAKAAGFRVETRRDWNDLQKRGYVVLNDRDRDYYRSRSSTREVRARDGTKVHLSKRAIEATQRVRRRIEEARRVTVRTT